MIRIYYINIIIILYLIKSTKNQYLTDIKNQACEKKFDYKLSDLISRFDENILTYLLIRF